MYKLLCILILLLVILYIIKRSDSEITTHIINYISNIFSVITCSRNENIITCNGISFPMNDISGVTNSLKLKIAYEPWFHTICEKYSDNTKLALDIGAHIGYHTIELSKYFKFVYAFEPNPDLFFYLHKNTKNIKNIKSYQLGVSNENNTLCFEKHNISTRSNIDYNKNCKVPIKTIAIDTMNIKDKIGIIKIDIEGGEIAALSGMSNIIRRDKPIIVFEDHTGDTIKYIKSTFDFYKDTIYMIEQSNYIILSE